MLTAVALLVFTASPPSLASPGWRAVNVDEKEAEFYADHLAALLSRRGLHVTTSTEIASIVGLERQKQMLGCSSESGSCAAELAGALGVDALLLGSVARFGDGFTVDVKVIAAKDGALIASTSSSAKTSEELLSWMKGAAPGLARAVYQKLRPGQPVGALSSGPPSVARAAVIVPAAVGVLGAAGALYSLTEARKAQDAIRSQPLDAADPSAGRTAMAAEAERGKLFQSLTYAGLAIAVVGIGSAVVLAAMGPGEDVTVSAVVTPAGAAFAASLRFP